MKTLRELDIVRAVPTTVVLQRAKAEPDDADEGVLLSDPMPMMVVRFSPFDTWYEIDSFWEGTFLERTTKGAFAKTMRESASRVKVLFNHGYDFNIGDKVLGVPENLREEKDGAVGDVQLLDTTYNRDLLPGLEAGAYGSSFMFRVIKDEWNDEPDASDHNPKGLPERTIKEVRLYEFGPVTWPANPEATAEIQRSLTDQYYQRMRDRDPHKVDELAARASKLRTSTDPQPTSVILAPATAEVEEAAPQDTNEPATSHSGGITPAQRRERLYPYLTERAS